MKSNVKSRWRMLFFLGILGMAAVWITLCRSLPDHLLVAADDGKESVLPGQFSGWVRESVAESVEASASGASNIPKGSLTLRGQDSYTVQCSLLGVVPLKEIQVDVVERQQLTPGGIPVGIYMKTEGVLIVGTGEVCGSDGSFQEPVGDIVHSGDYILAVNGVPVSKKEEVVRQMNQAADGRVQLQVLRGEEVIDMKVPVVRTGDEEYKAGIWIRDDTQGIGTLTYVASDGSFGALGHGISDIDTSTLLSLESGRLYETNIRSVIRGENGAPGELSGIIRYQKDKILGEITENTELGIFGTLRTAPEQLNGAEPVEIAYRQEIEPGAATLISAVNGEVREYDIEIEKVNLNSSDANKSMMIRVTDPELLALTGGIVQGMSGSPIKQNGRLVGAVTHVFVNDPAKGYAIFIEDMIEH